MTRRIQKPWEPEGEILRLETPEQIQVEFRIAPLGARIAALVLDQLILAGFSFILIVGAILTLVVMGAAITLEEVVSLGYSFLAVLLAVNFVVWTFYFVYMELEKDGQTYGKRILGIRTVMATGQGLTLPAALIRNLARIVDQSNPVMLIVPALDRGRRRIGDHLGGTIVVLVDERVDAPLPAPRRTATPGEPSLFFFSAAVHDRVVPDDLNLLEHFFRRLPTVSDEPQRQRLVRDLAYRYRARLEMDPAKVEENPEEFLRELHAYLHDRFDSSLPA